MEVLVALCSIRCCGCDRHLILWTCTSFLCPLLPVSVVSCPQLLISRQREATAGAAYKTVSEQSAALARQHALSLADIQRVTGEAEEAEAELDTRIAFLTRCAHDAPSLADMLRAQVELVCG